MSPNEGNGGASPEISANDLGRVIADALGAVGQVPIGIDSTVTTAPLAADVPGAPEEPIYDADAQADIQGNIIPGFNKDHQLFLFYSFGNRASQVKAREFLRWLRPYISTMGEVIAFRQLRRARRRRLGSGSVFLNSVGVNVAFSGSGIERLVGADELSKFGDIAFKEGLRNRASFLGDPTKPGAAGNPSKWVVGGAGNSADMVVILAADTCEDLQELQALIAEQADLANFKLIFKQYGNTLPGPLRGHEHFGFKDGISQPGVRGKLSATPGDYITPRYIDHSDGRRLYYSKPGQLLTWPGQYLLGEERQSTEYHDRSAPAATNFPGWARRGSYLVVRRLDQDVGAFWKFVIRTASTVGIPPARFAAMLVGRWPSGAPLMRVPNGDDPDLGADEFANNHFIFDDDTKPSNLVGLPGYPGDRYPPAKADFLAAVCPHFAHIRKINPRDSVGDLGKPDDNLARMILRRGIPFGRPVAGQENVTDDLLAEERGLMFLCYVGSIEDQFEFLQRRWANSDVQPNFGGHDPIIGQNGSDASRQRRIDFPTPGGKVEIHLPVDWVKPTGGGYFFAPTISAIRDVLGATP